MRLALYRMEHLSALHQVYAKALAEYARSKGEVEDIELRAKTSPGILQRTTASPPRDVIPTLPDDVVAVSFFDGPFAHDPDALDLVDGIFAFSV
jgi:hypothetical protein